MSPFMMIMAVLPAVVVFTYVYRKDTIEKEPTSLLARLFALGALSGVVAVVVELLLEGILLSGLREGTFMYRVVENFVTLALVEEAGKYIMLRRATWRSPHFNYLFDAVVYAVAVSLGFATLENVMYLMDGSLSTAIGRAILSVPGHAIYGVFMGCYYGAAKRCELAGDGNGRKHNMTLALVVPVLLHGFYDFAIDASLFIPFVLFEIVVTVSAVKCVRRFSREDAQL
ncbi:MAG: PrsW family intramembrane metalloprotease [Coriobacteriales bacterium]|nr:PrsW family intramembrane metalloprotease [Coriobacteriales bacterium]